jgi:hypothetical protein
MHGVLTALRTCLPGSRISSDFVDRLIAALTFSTKKMLALLSGCKDDQVPVLPKVTNICSNIFAIAHICNLHLLNICNSVSREISSDVLAPLRSKPLIYKSRIARITVKGPINVDFLNEHNTKNIVFA